MTHIRIEEMCSCRFMIGRLLIDGSLFLVVQWSGAMVS